MQRVFSHLVATRSRFFYARVSVLLAILIVVVAYAVTDVASRRARKRWDHTLAVAIVVLDQGVDPGTVDALRDRTPALAARLTRELHRYAPNAPAPFAFTVYGPLPLASGPPTAGEGIVSLASHAWELRKWTSDIDERAHLAAAAFDARIYVTAELPRSKKHMIEGASEQGGRVGTVTVDLDETTIDFSLAVIAHELFHTLDATDKDARTPEGTVDDEVEIMTHGRMVSANEERVLDTLDELAVGAVTAREIGWLK